MFVYLAGPMQGYPDFNFPAFKYYTEVLRKEGHIVFSPPENDIERHGGHEGVFKCPEGSIQKATELGFSLRDALGDDMAWICKNAEAIAMMPGWEYSKGANAEWALAKALGLEIWYLGERPL